jgi:RNA polymerase sigma-70 factor (ECF subfamily)
MEISSYYDRERVQTMDCQDYFNRIYDDTYSEILKFVIIKTSHADQVDDIMQNVYYNFYSRILKRGFTDIRFPEAFIIKLTQKELARHYKKTAEKKELETDINDYDEKIESDDISFDSMIENKEALNNVRSIVAKLPLLSFKSFILFYYYDMPIAKIAEQLSISEQNVKTRLWRARNAVRKELSL